MALTSCQTVRHRPCTDGMVAIKGEPKVGLNEKGYDPHPIKKCYRVRDSYGALVNHGKYFEWFGNDKIAVTGEYELGKRTGRWIEYNDDGIKISDKYYKEGIEVPAP